MHITDWITTIVHAAGLTEPTDRIIDGVSQLDWLTGKQSVSNRDGFIYWMGSENVRCEVARFQTCPHRPEILD